MRFSSSRSTRKPASPRKLAANRRNAARSTGPRTPQGKARSRVNAVKHGILASQTVISMIEGPPERRMFEETVAGLCADFQPVGAYEEMLVQEIAACFWRKRRLLRFENRAAFDAIEVPASDIVNHPFAKEFPWKQPLYVDGEKMITADNIYESTGLDGITLPNEKDTARVIRYEAAINRARKHALDSLRAAQAVRRRSIVRRLPAPAIDRVGQARNERAVYAKMLPAFFSARVWHNFGEIYRDAVYSTEEAAEAAIQETIDQLMKWDPEKDKTKPKNLSPAEMETRIKDALRETFAKPEAPKAPEDAPKASEEGALDADPDPNKPPKK